MRISGACPGENPARTRPGMGAASPKRACATSDGAPNPGTRVRPPASGRASNRAILAHDFHLHLILRADEVGELDAVVLGPHVAEPVADIAAQHERVVRVLAVRSLVGDEGEIG